MALRVHVTADSTSGLAQLFEEQHDTLNRYFLKRTAHAWDAQDLVQELYLRLLRTDPFHGERPRWVRASVYHYCFSTRAEKRRTGLVWMREPLGEAYPPRRLRAG